MGNSETFLRFTFPGDQGFSDMPLGLSIDTTGSLATVDEIGSIRQALFMLLSVRRAERIMRPEYGCELHTLLFQPNDDTTHGLAIFYVRKAIQKWEPRIEILALDAKRDEHAPSILLIELTYEIRRTKHIDSIAMAIDLSAERYT